MKMSQSFVKTLRQASSEETTKNGAFLTRAGYVHKEMAGIYDYLPLGLKVLENIKNIIREELNQIGCEELLMSTLQNPEPWEKTGRFSNQQVDIWFKTELSSGGELGLAPTHEEPITSLMKNYVKSYKDLPISAYQFQTKFRNEKRAKSGILRGREFLMKDLYSFHTTPEELEAYYDKIMKVYQNIFKRVGIGDITFPCFASGGIFSKYSHEFQTFLEVGEDTVYYNQDKSIVLNKEVYTEEVLNDLGVKPEELQTTNAAEVGNIFKLQTKFTDPLDLKFSDENNAEKIVYMGCYGIGVSRLMGVIAEVYADDKGLVWPESIAPFKYHLIAIGEKAEKIANDLYDKKPDSFLYDDREDLRVGEKFADADLIGLTYRVVISDKTLTENSVEITDRKSGKSKFLSLEAFQNSL
ncbi:prolyl-tRNA synthetase [Candidatus Saccharibacteria bacterium]|nr:prolyl-tRNA synthetase [Candidatus Saccharibacteria bacterium]